jgi:hypothetical protein
MNRVLYASAGIVLALLPVAAMGSPALSPTLDTVLVAPPSADFKELTTGQLHGSFTAHDWATSESSTRASDIEASLTHDGFVAGYGDTWVQASVAHALVEAVMAFTGGKGARDWLTSAEAGDKSDPSYQHADSISGIDPYYGGHFTYPSNSTIGDIFVFAKGNDIFVLGFVSQKDDVLNLAIAQTKAQYDAAPASTIPSSQWPENATHPASNLIGFIVAAIIVLLLVIGVVAFAARRTRGAAPAMVPAAVPAMGGPAMGTPAVIQMSPDGKFWWDGQGWKDTAVEIPPTAQRSPDGQSWWDGRGWRPVPRGT